MITDDHARKMAAALPEVHRAAVVKLEGWLERNFWGIPKSGEKSVYLFELYNTYIKKNSAESLDCARCRSKLRMYFKAIIKAIQDEQREKQD